MRRHPLARAVHLALILAALLTTVALAGCGGGSSHHAAATCQTPRAHSCGFGLPPKGVRAAPSVSGIPTVEMYDSVEVSTVPAGAQVVAGYVGGSWPTFSGLVQAFPRAAHVSIAVNAGERARCLDVEPGDATPSQVVSWYYADRAAGYSRPCFYAALYNGMGSIRANLTAAGISRVSYFLWDADWTYAYHLDAGNDCTQYSDQALGRNLDASACTQQVLGAGAVTPPPPPPDPYRVFEKTVRHFGSVRASEYNTVRTWDRVGCKTPVRRPTCKSSYFHLVLLERRLDFLAFHAWNGHRWVSRRPVWSGRGGASPPVVSIGVRRFDIHKRTRV